MTPAEQAPTSPRNHGLWRAKWRYIAGYWLTQTLAIFLIVLVFFSGESTPDPRRVLEALGDPALLVLAGIYSAVIALAQAVLFIPVRRPRMSIFSPGVRLLHSAVGGLAVGGLAWLAMWPVMALLDIMGVNSNGYHLLFDTNAGWVIPAAVAVVMTLLLWTSGRDGLPVLLSVALCALAAAMLLAALVGGAWAIPTVILGDDRLNHVTLGSMCAVVLIGWAIATPLVWSFVRRRGADDGLSRLASRLFLGTIIEAGCIIPLDVMIRRRTNCYCEEGTYWALAACWAVGFFALGPIIFLVPLSRRRKRWYAGRCEACGYDMSGCVTADRCPECGAGWKT